jgi:hypothetical protein
MWTPCDVLRFDCKAKRLANCEVPFRPGTMRPRAILSASVAIAHSGLLAHLVDQFRCLRLRQILVEGVAVRLLA